MSNVSTPHEPMDQEHFARVGRQIVGYLKTYQRSTRGRVLDIRTR